MCGIAGILSNDHSLADSRLIKKMTDSLAHRGPEGDAHWINPAGNLILGHRRLSIIDLSDAGAQPMHYMDRYTITYNGEIYNYKELRADLGKQGYQFGSLSDTEVILAAYDCYKESCLSYMDGMFAFAIWDEKDKTFFAARDRFGEKPFYFHQRPGYFAFASEMKALWSIGIPKTVDDKMMLNYITLGYVQNPADKSQTFFRNIYSLPPAHYILIKNGDSFFEIQPYWDIDKQNTQNISVTQAKQKLEELLHLSVSRRLRSDVEIGTSLSGGLDSSTIAWFVKNIMGNESAGFKTFSAVFPGYEKDESKYINEVCKYLSLENYHVTPTGSELIRDIEKVAWHQEEPFPSSSIYAQYRTFGLARKHGVKVLLDGQGADETLAGYHRYLHWYLQEVLSRNRFIRFKREKALLAKNKIELRWDVRNIIAAFLPSHVAIALEKAEYRRITTHPFINKALIGSSRGREWEGVHKPIITKLNDILYFNTMRNGLEELLRFADRNSMAHGVEVRLPFLQAELVSFIFSLPSSFKINDGFPKWILRSMMDAKLPSSIVWRTDKTGYEPPQKSWMEQPQMEDYIREAKRKLVNENILKPSVLDKKVKPMDAHMPDNFDWRYICASRLYP